MQEDGSAEAAVEAVTNVARRADELGFRRIWLAERHGYRSVGSVAPAVLAAQVAATTARIRVGSGGVLLPHHPPIVVAEQFATLAALHPAASTSVSLVDLVPSTIRYCVRCAASPVSKARRLSC